MAETTFKTFASALQSAKTRKNSLTDLSYNASYTKPLAIRKIGIFNTELDEIQQKYAKMIRRMEQATVVIPD